VSLVRAGTLEKILDEWLSKSELPVERTAPLFPTMPPHRGRWFDKEAINNNGLPSAGVQRRAGSPKRT